MVIGKKAQFFLLAAVIISAVIISLGFVANKAVSNRESGSIYDLSYEVKRETGAVMDYEIYTFTTDEGNLTDFVNLLAADINDRYPDLNFKFIYGNNTYLVERDYTHTTGSNSAISSKICMGVSCSGVTEKLGDYDSNTGVTVYDAEDNKEINSFSVDIDGNEFTFPISKHRQVIFIVKKETEDETFVSAE